MRPFSHSFQPINDTSLAVTPPLEPIQDLNFRMGISGVFLQQQKRIVIYYVKKFVKESQ